MLKSKKITGLTYLGLFLTLSGLAAAFLLASQYWYSLFTVGGTIFLASLNYQLGNPSILRTFEQNKKRFLAIYFAYFLAGVMIELVGKSLLKLWQNPLTPAEQIVHVFLIAYPFAFFLLYESFILFKKYLRSSAPALLIATFLNAFLHEIPNTYAWPWQYNIPYVSWEIFQINIVVIVGWLILMAVPLLVAKIIK